MVAAAATLGKIGFELFFNGKQAMAGMSKMEKSFGRLKKVAMLAIGGKMVKQAAEFGKQMTLMSDRVGMSIAKLASLRGAFTSAGVGAKGFEKTINNISSGLLGLSRGRGEFAAKLGMLGISPYGVNGQLKKPDEVLYDIADWAKGQKDSGMMSEQDIMYLLMSEFGFDEATAKMAMGGSQAIKDEAERAQREGRAISPEEARKLTETSKKLAEVWEALKTVGERLVVVVSPLINGVANGLKTLGEAMNVFLLTIEPLNPVIDALGDLLGTVLGGAIKVVAGLLWELAEVLKFLGGIIHWFGEIIGELVAWIQDKLGLGEKHDATKGWELMQRVMTDGKLDPTKMREALTSSDFSSDERNKIKGWYEQTYGAAKHPTNVEQAVNPSNGGMNIQDNTKIEVVVQGNMDSETYERMKTEFPQDKYNWVKEDMSG